MKDPVWKSAKMMRQSLPELPLRAWLLHKGSFMKKLKATGAHQPRIEVVSETWQSPSPHERARLNLSTRSLALVREVVICSDEGMWMYARTVLPQATLTGAEKQLSRLKNRSLGSKLFRDKTMTRSDFEVARFQSGMDWYDKIHLFATQSMETYWGRCSVFHIKNKPLLLTEIFLSSQLLENSYVD